MLLKIILTLITFCSAASLSIGQSKQVITKKENIDAFFKHKNEFGANMTNVLGNLLSLNPNNVNSPYSIIYRRHFGKTSLRLGANFDRDASSSFDFFDNSIKETTSKENTINGRIGLEWHMPISKRLMTSYGFDFLTDVYKDDSEIDETTFTNTGQTTFNNFRSEERTLGFGGGPILRFDFKFNDRLSISTESTFYFTNAHSTDKLYQNDQLVISNKSDAQKYVLTLPQSLYVNLAF